MSSQAKTLGKLELLWKTTEAFLTESHRPADAGLPAGRWKKMAVIAGKRRTVR